MDISPSGEVVLAGFANPNRTYLGNHDPLYLSATVFEQENVKVAVVTADVLCFDHALLIPVREAIEARTGIPKDNILFNATHTHSAPTTYVSPNLHCGIYKEPYGSFFYQSVADAVAAANDDLEDGKLYFGTGLCYGVGVNRRNISTGIYRFAPYEEGLRNDEVTVLKAVCGGKVKALLFQYACHPSTIGFNYASADYPGVANRILREKYGCIVGMMQGCGGNIRARTVDDSGQNFRGGKYEDIERFGTMLAETVEKVLACPMTEAEGRVDARLSEFMLPLAEKKPKEYYAALAEAKKAVEYESWAYQYYADNYDTLWTEVPYSIQCLDLGDNLSLFAMEGDVCVEYDYHVKKMAPHRHMVVCGYSNGLPGYICSEDMYPYGGYEPKDSAAGSLTVEGIGRL